MKKPKLTTHPAIELMKLAEHWRLRVPVAHRKVLEAFKELSETNNDDYYFPFKSVVNITGQDVRAVRLITRHLSRRGLTEFCAGLFDDDGKVAGSGYRITKRGKTLLELTNKNSLPSAAELP